MKENNKVTELDIFKAIYFKYNTKAFNAVCPHVSIELARMNLFAE